MGHADIQTTMRYLHFAPRDEDAALVSDAFAVTQPSEAAFGSTDDPARRNARFAGRRPRPSQDP